MRLQRLAGMGATAAVLSGVSMLLTVLVWVFVSAELRGVLLLLLTTVWLGSMAVTGLDLDWMAHPDTHNGRLLASLWLAIAGAFLPLLIALATVTGMPASILQLLLCLIGLAASGFTVLHNLEAHRVRLLTGVLPWVGIVAGVFFLVFWLGVLLTLPVLVFPGLFVGGVLYAVWAIWLGVRLRRRPVPVPAAVT